ncbi:MAG: hypothetical protein EOP34_04415 [Rickettsiales bacterium]|nr:MAG: hypothetical protein EOP34_04415 [Rickettsiales bacterium]
MDDKHLTDLFEHLITRLSNIENKLNDLDDMKKSIDFVKYGIIKNDISNILATKSYKLIVSLIAKWSYNNQFDYIYCLGALVSDIVYRGKLNDNTLSIIYQALSLVWKQTRKSTWPDIDKPFCDGYYSVCNNSIKTSYELWNYDHLKPHQISTVKFPTIKHINKMKEYFKETL